MVIRSRVTPLMGGRHETEYRAVDALTTYRNAGVGRVNILVGQGPYDRKALEAFAEVALPAFGGRGGRS